jgi:hypothetical protein
MAASAYGLDMNLIEDQVFKPSEVDEKLFSLGKTPVKSEFFHFFLSIPLHLF